MPGRVVHCKKEPYDIYIGRGKCPVTGQRSIWGNPFTHLPHARASFRVETRSEAIAKYEEYIRSRPDLIAALADLRGKTLGCWCRPRYSCHGDVLLRLIDEFYPDASRIDHLFS
jgi:hypothetical protein